MFPFSCGFIHQEKYKKMSSAISGGMKKSMCFLSLCFPSFKGRNVFLEMFSQSLDTVNSDLKSKEEFTEVGQLKSFSKILRGSKSCLKESTL